MSFASFIPSCTSSIRSSRRRCGCCSMPTSRVTKSGTACKPRDTMSAHWTKSRHLISGPEYGAHLLSADGRRLAVLPRRPARRRVAAAARRPSAAVRGAAAGPRGVPRERRRRGGGGRRLPGPLALGQDFAGARAVRPRRELHGRRRARAGDPRRDAASRTPARRSRASRTRAEDPPAANPPPRRTGS